mmetsp:Transcript_92475/g.160626  ORF Transcript_92475/g.160626 Transcript_92475/m.160626 type:complete len:407 (-) Transcript_92475:69-1289(-)
MDRSGRSGGGGPPPAAGGYSRRCGPGDPKSTDRHRLLTDRAAYISFLEAQAERTNAICSEAEEVSATVHRMRGRVEELEEKLRSTARAVELVQEHGSRAGESAREGRRELEEQLRLLESRVQRLENSLGDSRSTVEAEMARLRNEVALAVQDLGQRVDERLQALRAWRSEADEGASGLIREAQATCVRLADDALGAAEASQRKLDELSRRTEASLEVLRVDVTGLRAELAGYTRGRSRSAEPTPRAASPPAATPLAAGSVPTAIAQGVSEEATSAMADVIERRLAARLGQQVLQLSEVLRRVVQAQATLHHQWSCSPQGGAPTRPVPQPMPMADAGGGPEAAPDMTKSFGTILDSALAGATVGAGPMPGGDTRRRAAIDELYRELRQLEECDAAVRGSAVRRKSSR